MSNIKDKVKENYGKAIVEHTQKPGAQQTRCSSSVNTENTSKESTPSFGLLDSLAIEANIKLGDVVVDLGSGAGHDVFKAAALVGSNGRVIGIDFTPEMLFASLKTTAEKRLTNVDFRYSDIENISTLPDNFADVVISDCVINLTTNKSAVFKEVFRILKPGGRLVDVDNIALEKTTCDVTSDSEDWCACVSGALTQDESIIKIKEAGFSQVTVKDLKYWNHKGNDYKSGIIEAIKP
jgi:ubiquinone/menaquinone biosynthesis C-methylase UbiE